MIIDVRCFHNASQVLSHYFQSMEATVHSVPGQVVQLSVEGEHSPDLESVTTLLQSMAGSLAPDLRLKTRIATHRPVQV